MLLSFLALALGLIALQAAGSAVGWGFQLQEPGMVFVLALLFFAIGLNLMGAFEFANLLPQRAARVARAAAGQRCLCLRRAGGGGGQPLHRARSWARRWAMR